MAIANITNNILTDSGVSTSSLLPLSGGTLTGALSGTSATFSDSSTLLTLSSGAGTKAVFATTRNFGVNRNFQIAVDEFAESAFTITPSTTLGGSVYTTPIFTLAAAGAATFSSRVNVNGAVDNASYKLNSIGTTYLQQGDFIQDTYLNAAPIFYYQMKKARGTSTVPLSLNNNDLVGGILALGYTGSNYISSSAIDFKVTGTISASAMPISIRFQTGSSSVTNSSVCMVLSHLGNTLIGQNPTDDTINKLQVTGSAKISGAVEIGNAVSASVSNVVTNKVSVVIGGVQYYLLASTSAT